MNLIDNLKKHKLELPELTVQGGSYVSVNIRVNIAYVAIQFPIKNKVYLYQGKLGNNLSTQDGYKAMELCALNVIAQIHAKISFENVIGLNHIDAYYQSSKNWDDAPTVVNGASDVFVNILEEKGEHSRSIFGVQNLPRNFGVGLTATFTIKT
ncbi:RidA family protein [Changchengzhania lutea]|uniref:RidA family protein n=1 Tax=Changchengzhania lutea TaxID=2049305 RepID=UPI00115D6C3C|nr:RidA family protein [Changchengzhania lutea]